MAEDYTSQRRDLAVKVAAAATQIVTGINAIIAVGPELAQKGGGFDDADCIDTLSYLNAWKLNTLVDVVAPALKAVSETPIDKVGGVTYKDILMAVKLA